MNERLDFTEMTLQQSSSRTQRSMQQLLGVVVICALVAQVAGHAVLTSPRAWNPVSFMSLSLLLLSCRLKEDDVGWRVKIDVDVGTYSNQVKAIHVELEQLSLQLLVQLLLVQHSRLHGVW